MDGPMESVWRAQREAAARFTDSWRDLLDGTTARPSPAATAADVEERLRELVRTVTEHTAAVLAPLRDLAQSQREFADHMARWAELQRDLADDVAAWAGRQRQYADHLDGLLAGPPPPDEDPQPAGEA